MEIKSILRMFVMVVWSILCLLAAVQGFSGQLAPFFAGFGWLILAVMSIVLIYSYYKLNKMLREIEMMTDWVRTEMGHKKDE